MGANDTYDSRPDTSAHIDRVRELLSQVRSNLAIRASCHDASKLQDPEKPIFDKYTPLLRDTTYGSDEYRTYLGEMKVALDHHYGANTHHPEHYAAGISGMSLLDAIEMLCDWKAATERHADGDLAKSIEMNQERFGYSDDIRAWLTNTARELDLL